jgi:hypothetical protein
MSTVIMPTRVPTLTPELRTAVEAVLTKAATDVRFREQLQTDPDAALAGAGLPPGVCEFVSQLRRVGLEEWGIDVRRFRSFLRDNGNKVVPDVPDLDRVLG